MIRLSKSCISSYETKRVLKVLKKEYLGMGKEVELFENKLSNYFNRKAICVNTGTSAIQLAIESCNFKEGDEILVPSLTYLATFQAITAARAVPIACDIDLETFIICINDAKNKISNKTKAIMPVHFTGCAGPLDKIYDFAKEFKLRVIEDAAHAFGSKFNDKLIGSFGDIACFSFDGIKNITSGEGGCVVTNDVKIINKVKDKRLLSVHRDTENRFKGKRSWDFDVNSQGWRYHMSNIMAAIGIEQFKRKNNLFNKRKRLAIKYDNLLKDHSKIQILNRNYNQIVPHIYVIIIKGKFNRNLFRKELANFKIETGIHYKPNHLLSFYNKKIRLKNTEKVYPKLLTLPLHPDLKIKDIKYIVDKLNYLIFIKRMVT